MQPLQPAAQGVQAKRRMVRIQFQELQGREILLFKLGMAPQKTRGALQVLLGEDQLKTQADFFARLTC